MLPYIPENIYDSPNMLFEIDTGVEAMGCRYCGLDLKIWPRPKPDPIVPGLDGPIVK